MATRRHVSAAIASLFVGGIVGCFSLPDSSSSHGCAYCPGTNQGPAPANAVSSVDASGCTSWACPTGFTVCGSVCVDLLGDARNCGACGNDCGTSTCHEGSCFAVEVLATGLASPGAIALDQTYAYVIASDGIHRVPKHSGATELFAAGKVNEAMLAADASGVYWVEGATVFSATSPGQTPTVLDVGSASESFNVGPLLLDAHYVYWLSLIDLDPDAGSDHGRVWRVPKTGGPAEAVYVLSDVALIDPGGGPLATDLGRLAVSDATNLVVVAPDGGSSVVAEQAPTFASLTADGSSVYWIAGAKITISLCGGLWGNCPPGPAVPDGIFAVGWDGGATRTVSPTSGGLHDLRASGSALWGLTNALPRTLSKVHLTTGVHTVVAGGGAIRGFAVDPTGAYWSRDDRLLSTH